jgi:predicted Zn-dependent protease
MSTTHDELVEKIEKVVEEHMAASRRAAEMAVQRAFARSSAAPRRAVRRRGPAKGFKRRTPEEIAALGERFYEAVVARPGETMSVLSAEVGVTSRELHRSVTNLKAAGRVRSAGHKHMTRYFPMG